MGEGSCSPLLLLPLSSKGVNPTLVNVTDVAKVTNVNYKPVISGF